MLPCYCRFGLVERKFRFLPRHGRRRTARLQLVPASGTNAALAVRRLPDYGVATAADTRRGQDTTAHAPTRYSTPQNSRANVFRDAAGRGDQTSLGHAPGKANLASVRPDEPSGQQDAAGQADRRRQAPSNYPKTSGPASRPSKTSPILRPETPRGPLQTCFRIVSKGGSRRQARAGVATLGLLAVS